MIFLQDLKTLLEVEKEVSKMYKDALSKKDDYKALAEASDKEYELKQLNEAEAQIALLNENTKKEISRLTKDFDKKIIELKETLKNDIDEKVQKAVNKLLEAIVL